MSSNENRDSLGGGDDEVGPLGLGADVDVAEFALPGKQC